MPLRRVPFQLSCPACMCVLFRLQASALSLRRHACYTFPMGLVLACELLGVLGGVDAVVLVVDEVEPRHRLQLELRVGRVTRSHTLEVG